MASPREEILDWVAAGRLRPADVPRALAIAAAEPGPAEWRVFLRALLLWGGVLLTAAGVIFFFAYNIRDFSRLGKLGAAEALLALACAVAVWRGPETGLGRAALSASCLFTGALLALFGQTYQTGADSFALFVAWAALILPWVWLGRFGPLWMLWIVLIDAAIVTYFYARPWGLAGVAFGMPEMHWIGFLFNSAALVLWERAAWLPRWGARTLGLLTGGMATTLGVQAFHRSNGIERGVLAIYLLWAVTTYVYYRDRRLDIFMLSGLVLSFIVMFVATFGYLVVDHMEVFGLFVCAAGIIGFSALGARWIRALAKEQRP
jgi:uncharacterized membrane protein